MKQSRTKLGWKQMINFLKTFFTGNSKSVNKGNHRNKTQLPMKFHKDSQLRCDSRVQKQFHYFLIITPDLYKKERKEKDKNWWVMGINHKCILLKSVDKIMKHDFISSCFFMTCKSSWCYEA